MTEHWFRYKHPTYKEVKRFTKHSDGTITAVSYWVSRGDGRYNITKDRNPSLILPPSPNTWAPITPEEGMALAAEWRFTSR